MKYLLDDENNDPNQNNGDFGQCVNTTFHHGGLGLDTTKHTNVIVNTKPARKPRRKHKETMRKKWGIYAE
jgi:hypothetical protein